MVKIAISVDKQLVKAANAAARKLAVGERLFSIAMDKSLHDRRNEEMLEKLNRTTLESQVLKIAES